MELPRLAAPTSVLAPVSPVVAALRRFVASRSESLGHLAWYLAHIEAVRAAELPHLGDAAYLDYAGAALYSRQQVQAAHAQLLDRFLANPHTSAATEEVIDRTRHLVLETCGASTATHTVVFTSGATEALRLVGENFRWSTNSMYVYAHDNHTSVLGLRQFALRAGVACGTFALEDLPRLQHEGLAVATPLGACTRVWPGKFGADGPHLLALPGESNFSGERPDLRCVRAFRAGAPGWRVLLDAAKLACSPGSLDLSACPADFAVVSFYKIFGYPTGLGALLVRHDAAPLLAPRWGQGAAGCAGPESAFGPSYFAGGTVAAVSSTSSFAVPRPALAEWLERGTSHFLGIAALAPQLTAVRALASDEARRQHALAVCREAYVLMRALRHSSGRRLCQIYGRHEEPRWWEVQGPTIAVHCTYADGSPVPYGDVAEKARARHIILRTGCHCNAGACQRHLSLSDGDVRHFFASGKVCGDDKGIVDGRPAGVVRVSFGLYSTLADAHRWVAMLEEELVDRLPVDGGGEATVREEERLCPLASHAVSAIPALTGFIGSTLPEMAATSEHIDGSPEEGSIVALKVYPIKGCGPLRVRSWPVDFATGGLFLDRRWCLAADGSPASSRVRPLSAKLAPRLTQVRLSLQRRRFRAPEGVEWVLVLSAKGCETELALPLTRSDSEVLRRAGAETEEADGLKVAADGEEEGGAGGASERAARWFEALLALPKLRLLEAEGASPGTGEMPARRNHFANAPSTLLLVSTTSLREFGRLCGLAVPAERFRANLEVAFDRPFAEAAWPTGGGVHVGPLAFEAAGRCVRCQAVDIDPGDTAATGPSLLAALATAQPGGNGGKGPTFGTLLRLRRGSRAQAIGSALPSLGVGMRVARELAPGPQGWGA